MLHPGYGVSPCVVIRPKGPIANADRSSSVSGLSGSRLLAASTKSRGVSQHQAAPSLANRVFGMAGNLAGLCAAKGAPLVGNEAGAKRPLNLLLEHFTT